MSTVLQDVRFGVRQLLTSRGTSVLAVLTLALAIGATTSILTVVDSTMMRPLPYPEPEQLVSLGVTESRPDGRTANVNPSFEDLRSLRAATDLFAAVEGFGGPPNGMVADGPEPERLGVVTFTEGYLAMHGVAPLLGRDFTAADFVGSAPRVALLGYGYWRSRFGGRDPIGETLRLDGHVVTIVGVLPALFNPNTPVSLPLVLAPDQARRRGLGSALNVVARLRPDVTIDMATTRGSALVAGLDPDGAAASIAAPARLRVTSRLETVTRLQRPTVNVLVGAVGLVLLIACVNVAGLLLARGAARQAEMAVRAALGATRRRLVRQVLTESLVLAASGTALGVLLAWLTLDLFLAHVPLFVPSNSPAAVNTTVLAGTLAVLLPATIGIGLLPALRLSRARIGASISSGSRLGSTPLSRRGGQTLIAIEVALAVVLVAGAGLMIRSFSKLVAVDLGFTPRGLLTMQVLPLDRTAAVHEAYYAALIERARTLPGVVSVAVSDAFHLGTGTRMSAARGSGGDTPVAVYRVTPEYFDTIGATLVAGRWPAASAAAALPRETVINQTAARALFADGPAVGRVVTPAGAGALPHTVVGVVADVRNGGPTGARGASGAHVYYPFALGDRDVTSAMTVILRTSTTPELVAADLRRAAHAVGPRALVEQMRSGDELFGAGVATPRRRTVMIGLLGGLGLLHALVGIVGVTTYAVSRRTREVGVRLALGARPGQMAAAVLRDAAMPVVIGAMVGVGAATMATRAIASFLFETSPVDPPTLLLATGGLVVAGVLAAAWPASRASRVDPVTSLRAE